MKYIYSILFICCFSIANAQEKHIKADILLDGSLLNQLSINEKFISSIEYTSGNFILLSSLNQFFILGVGGIIPISDYWTYKTEIESFVVRTDGILLVASGNTIYQAYSNPAFIKVATIPNSNMGITSKYNNIFVYDRTSKSTKNGYSIYQISKNKKITSLVTIPTPVLSVFEQPSQLIFSTKNILFGLDIKTHKLYQILALPQESDIISVVGDTINHAFYFSTDQTIYRLKDDKLEIVSTDFGGILKYDGEGLVIFKPEKSLIVRLRNNILYPTADNKIDLSKLELTVSKTPDNPQLAQTVDIPRLMILTGQIPQAIQLYAQLAKRTNVNFAVFLEYAYALALGGMYDGALMNLDKAKNFGTFTDKDYFYAGQVFALMGNNQTAENLLTQCTVPQWIFPKYNEFYQKYNSIPPMPQENDLAAMFKRANYLASNGMNFQSVALFEQLLTENPDEYIFHVGYSIPLEKVGLRTLAAKELQTGISLMGNDPQYTEAKAAFNQRLEKLNQPESEKTVTKSNSLPQPDKFKPQTMMYLGGTFSSGYTSFNSQFGFFLSKSFNGAINLGVSGNSDATFINLGLSAYKRLGNVFMLGIGINDAIGGESNTFSIAPTFGFSFVNRKRNSSWDIFFNINIPLQAEASTVFGISVGKSFYFGRRK